MVALRAEQTSVFSEGAVRVPNSGVVKFSQNSSLLKEGKKATLHLRFFAVCFILAAAKTRSLLAEDRDGAVPAVLPQRQQEGERRSV